jgi:2-phospho-L-lactate guanylyltransferase
MAIWAIIPAKRAQEAKSRLSSVLSSVERAELARRLLRGAVCAALACTALTRVVVVTADEELAALARSLGATVSPEPRPVLGEPFNAALREAVAEAADRRDNVLNAALREGCRLAASQGAGAVLILPTDLPLLAPEVIEEFLDEAGDAAVAVAPDRAGIGTNALLLRPPLAIAPAFGPNSFLRHRKLAHEQRLSVATVSLPELALDLDGPDDLQLLGYQGAIRTPEVARGC